MSNTDPAPVRDAAESEWDLDLIARLDELHANVSPLPYKVAWRNANGVRVDDARGLRVAEFGSGNFRATKNSEAFVAFLESWPQISTELTALRARVAGLEAERDAIALAREGAHQAVRIQSDELRELRLKLTDARALLAVELRANAKLRVALELSRCECSVSVQPPHAFKCGRCSALDDERLRALAQPRAERETKDV